MKKKKKRLENENQPLRSSPSGVSHSGNMAEPQDWIDPLNGYTYDCFNPDALMQMKVVKGKVVLPGGASYALLVLPYQHPMQPNAGMMSVPVAKKLLQLVKDGATVIMSKDYKTAVGLKQRDDSISSIIKQLFQRGGERGKVVMLPYAESSFDKFGLQKDVDVISPKHSIAWTHRKAGETDIYFISNQLSQLQKVSLSFRVKGKDLNVLDPVTAKRVYKYLSKEERGRTHVEIMLEANESLFFIFDSKTAANKTASFIAPATSNYF